MLISVPKCFIPFPTTISNPQIPEMLNDPFEGIPSELTQLAANEVKSYLSTTSDFEHNFGLDSNNPLKPHGKMFGVLVVQNGEGDLGYLMAYSGKLLGENKVGKFVPPVGQANRDEEFVNAGMTELTRMGHEIAKLKSEIHSENELSLLEQIQSLKETRAAHSQNLQQKIFEAYYFSNSEGDQKTLLEIFEESRGIRPPSGAGECAAPKLLQYAFDNNLKPVAIAEFWWGKPRKSMDKAHGSFYPACEDKCRPILSFMLEGLIRVALCE